MNKSPAWMELEEIESKLCVVTSEQIGVDLSEVNPESRFIEDFHLDSLDLVELVMEIEDIFEITIPDTPKTPVGKLIFTRQPFRIRDLAEYVYLNQGSGKPTRCRIRKNAGRLAVAPESGFTQLGGRLNQGDAEESRLHERLDRTSRFPMYSRFTDGMVCIELPAASVGIGSDNEDAHNDEKPCHSVTLSSFLIDIEPVSVTAFCRFLNSTDADECDLNELIGLAANDDRQCDMQFEQRDQTWKPRSGTQMQPVVMVSWFAASAYSKWANGREWSETQFENSFLPTEAQWEYAAQGSFDDLDKVYAGLHQRGDKYVQSGLPIPFVQQSYGESKFGLRHMSGTIWHWCRDCFSPSFNRTGETAIQLDPVCEIETGIRSERGGSWVGPIELCRPNYRRGRNPDAKGRCLGFRCVGNPVERRSR